MYSTRAPLRYNSRTPVSEALYLTIIPSKRILYNIENIKRVFYSNLKKRKKKSPGDPGQDSWAVKGPRTTFSKPQL
jgi:hypothetical protein